MLLLVIISGFLCPTVAYSNQSRSAVGCQKRVVLRKNIVNGKNILTQSMINKPNTTYIIRRDYLLSEDITIPANCVLKFRGGSICGGRITGSNTIIKYKSQVFDHVDLKGSWNVPVIHSDMFTEKEDDNFLPKLFQLCNKDIHNDVIIDPGTYLVHTKTTGYTIPVVYSNTTIEIQGTIKIDSDNRDGGLGFICTGEDIHIKGEGKIIGDRSTNTSDTEWSPVFFCNNCDNLIIEGITIEDSYGDGVYCRYNCNNVKIEGVTFINNRRCAVAFNSGRNNIIKNCVFIGNGGRAPGCAVEFENDGSDVDIPIVNCSVVDNYFKQNDRDIVLGAGNTYTDNIVIKGNKSESSVKSFFSMPGMKSNYAIKNVFIEGNTVSGCFMFANACFKYKAVIRGNTIKTEASDEKIPCLNIKGNVLCEDNSIYCPNMPVFENTYGGYYDSEFDILNNEITALNGILQLNNSTLKGNNFVLNHLSLFLYNQSECKDNRFKGTLSSGHLLYLGLNDSEFNENDLDFNNTPNCGIKLVRKIGKSSMENNSYKNVSSRSSVIDGNVE